MRGDATAPGEDWDLCEGILEEYSRKLIGGEKERLIFPQEMIDYLYEWSDRTKPPTLKGILSELRHCFHQSLYEHPIAAMRLRIALSLAAKAICDSTKEAA